MKTCTRTHSYISMIGTTEFSNIEASNFKMSFHTISVRFPQANLSCYILLEGACRPKRSLIYKILALSCNVLTFDVLLFNY